MEYYRSIGNPQDLRMRSELIWRLYQYYLSEIVNILNQEQKVDHNKKYWEIILGAWLQKYIAVLYDRYLSIKKYSSINKVFVAHVTEDIKIKGFQKTYRICGK